MIGERRIRVITLALPVSDGLSDLFASADPYAITTLLTKKGIIFVLALLFIRIRSKLSIEH